MQDPTTSCPWTFSYWPHVQLRRSLQAWEFKPKSALSRFLCLFVLNRTGHAEWYTQGSRHRWIGLEPNCLAIAAPEYQVLFVAFNINWHTRIAQIHHVSSSTLCWALQCGAQLELDTFDGLKSGSLIQICPNIVAIKPWLVSANQMGFHIPHIQT